MGGFGNLGNMQLGPYASLPDPDLIAALIPDSQSFYSPYLAASQEPIPTAAAARLSSPSAAVSASWDRPVTPSKIKLTPLDSSPRPVAGQQQPVLSRQGSKQSGQKPYSRRNSNTVQQAVDPATNLAAVQQSSGIVALPSKAIPTQGASIEQEEHQVAKASESSRSVSESEDSEESSSSSEGSSDAEGKPPNKAAEQATGSAEPVARPQSQPADTFVDAALLKQPLTAVQEQGLNQQLSGNLDKQGSGAQFKPKKRWFN